MTIQEMREILGLADSLPDEDVVEAYAVHAGISFAEENVQEPVSIELAKAQCRIDGSEEDALLSLYIGAARQWVEDYTGHILMRRTITHQADCFGRWIDLYRAPVISITSVGYLDTDGEAQTYVGASYDLNRSPVRITHARGGSWPFGDSVLVTYVAGYLPDDVPQALMQAMLLLIAHWWANRENVVIGSAANEVPFATRALCDQYRQIVV